VNPEKIARYRAEIVEQVIASVYAGNSKRAALKQFGVSGPTYFRWKKLFDTGGIDALKPRYWNQERRTKEVAK